MLNPSINPIAPSRPHVGRSGRWLQAQLTASTFYMMYGDIQKTRRPRMNA